jgi:hypothetical protein|tara:strand:- start:375 stop:542 length:168 start_codon:yes stop_codon:yes gene_type:complete
MALPKHTKRLSKRQWLRRSNIRKDLYRNWKNLTNSGEIDEGMQEQWNNFMIRTMK